MQRAASGAYKTHSHSGVRLTSYLCRSLPAQALFGKKEAKGAAQKATKEAKKATGGFQLPSLGGGAKKAEKTAKKASGGFQLPSFGGGGETRRQQQCSETWSAASHACLALAGAPGRLRRRQRRPAEVSSCPALAAEVRPLIAADELTRASSLQTPALGSRGLKDCKEGRQRLPAAQPWRRR